MRTEGGNETCELVVGDFGSRIGDVVGRGVRLIARAFNIFLKRNTGPAILCDTNKVNINGGAIALGHPLGCTGSKLTVQILNDLERLNKKYGIVTACVGGGQGIAGVIERL